MRPEKLGEIGTVVAFTLERETIVQEVTDITTELTHAEFGAFFHNVIDPESGDAYALDTLSGAPREAFAKCLQPRATASAGVPGIRHSNDSVAGKQKKEVRP